ERKLTVTSDRRRADDRSRHRPRCRAYGVGRRAAVAPGGDFAAFAFADFFLLLRAAFFFFTVFSFATFLSTLLAAGFGESAAAAAVPARIATSQSARTKVLNMLPLGTAFIWTAQLRGAHPIDSRREAAAS